MPELISSSFSNFSCRRCSPFCFLTFWTQSRCLLKSSASRSAVARGQWFSGLGKQYRCKVLTWKGFGGLKQGNIEVLRSDHANMMQRWHIFVWYSPSFASSPKADVQSTQLLTIKQTVSLKKQNKETLKSPSPPPWHRLLLLPDACGPDLRE